MAVERESSIHAPTSRRRRRLDLQSPEAVPPTSAADTTRSELRQADVNPVAAARGPGPGRPKEQEKDGALLIEN